MRYRVEKSLYHELGRFIVGFQNIEKQIEDIIVEIVNGNDEFVSILITPYSFESLLKSADVLFSRYAQERNLSESEYKTFSKIITRCVKLSELRNNLVHSKYAELTENGSVVALVRENSKLNRGEFARIEETEDLTSEFFILSFNRIEAILNELEVFRIKIINLNTEQTGLP
jgi:hypothetical protein